MHFSRDKLSVVLWNICFSLSSSPFKKKSNQAFEETSLFTLEELH